MPSSARTRKSEVGSGLRFVVVDHPDKLKDKDELRKNRQHVMLDHLERTRRSSDDSHANDSGHKRKRKRDGSSPECSSNSSAPINIFRAEPPRMSKSSSGDRIASSKLSSNHDQSLLLVPKVLPPIERDGVPGALTRQRLSVPSTGASSLVAGMSGRYSNHSYHGADVNAVPFTAGRLGTSLNPFDTWPKLSETSINTNELKWSCEYRRLSYSLSVVDTASR